MLSEEATASGRRRASRLAELEKAVELLKQEKREEKEKFEFEKVCVCVASYKRVSFTCLVPSGFEIQVFFVYNPTFWKRTSYLEN